MMYNSLANQMKILLFVSGDLMDVILKFQNASKTLFKWFNDNQMNANPDKCHLICSTSVKISIMIENKQIRNSSCEIRCAF